MGSDGPPRSGPPEATTAAGEIWAVEVLEALGWKGNAETLAVAAADCQKHHGEQRTTINVKLINITSLVPCGMGSSLPVSKVDKSVIKSHEIRVFKEVIAPLLKTAAAKKLNPRYVPARNDIRGDGILELAQKMKASRVYVPLKRSSKLVEKLVEDMPVGCSVIGVLGGRKAQELTALSVEVFDSAAVEGTSTEAQLSRANSIDYYDNMRETNIITYSEEGASGLSRMLCHASPSGSFQERSGSPSPTMPFRSQSFNARAFAKPSCGESLSPFNNCTIVEGCDEVHSMSMQFPLSGSSEGSASLEVPQWNRSAAQSPAPRLTPKTQESSSETPETPRTKSSGPGSSDVSSSMMPARISPAGSKAQALSKEGSLGRKSKGSSGILGMKNPFAVLTKTRSKSRSNGTNDGKAIHCIGVGHSSPCLTSDASVDPEFDIDDTSLVLHSSAISQVEAATVQPSIPATKFCSQGTVPLQP